MTHLKQYLFCCFLLLFSFTTSEAAVITAQDSGGLWNQTETWIGGVIPTANDTAVINSAIVIVNSRVTVAKIYLKNAANISKSELIIESSDTLTVTNDIVGIAYDHNQDVILQVKSNSVLIVEGDIHFYRTADNFTKEVLRLYLYGNSKTFVEGDFTFDYKNGDTGASDFHILTAGYAELDVTGKTTLITRDGGDLDFKLTEYSKVYLRDSLKLLLLGGDETAITADHFSEIQILAPAYLLNDGGSNHTKLKVGDSGGKMTVTGDITMESTGTDLDIKLEARGNSAEFNALGDIIMDAFAENDVVIDLKEEGVMKFGGNLIRNTLYGRLKMATDATLVFDGGAGQMIPQTKLDGSGADSLLFGKVLFENTAGLTLAGNMRITDTLFLDAGSIQTTDAALLIIDDGAVISGASNKAYIDGPMIKKGSTNGNSFMFPVGDNGLYAPIEIEVMSSKDLEYRVEFTGCPPPVGVKVNPLKSINNQGFWEVERSDGARVGNISLYWDDADNIGITDMSSLVVAYESPGGWISLGKGTTSGSIGAASGSIANDTGCPPPVGANLFVLGSTNVNSNVLPVEFVDFKAYHSSDHSTVFLEWETISETNSDYFVVEKSLDGITFEKIDRVEAAINSNTLIAYDAIDENPIKGNNYYRIQQVDQDQTMSFSPLLNVFIRIQDQEIPVAFPNPIGDQLNVYSQAFKDNDEIFIMIVDNAGKAVYRNTHLVQQGQLVLNTRLLNMEVPGIYFLSYVYEGRAYTLELLKVKP